MSDPRRSGCCRCRRQLGVQGQGLLEALRNNFWHTWVIGERLRLPREEEDSAEGGEGDGGELEHHLVVLGGRW